MDLSVSNETDKNDEKFKSINSNLSKEKVESKLGKC